MLLPDSVGICLMREIPWTHQKDDWFSKGNKRIKKRVYLHPKVTSFYLNIGPHSHIFIPFFCATTITAKSQATRFNKSPEPPGLKPVRFSTAVFCLLPHRAYSTRPFTSFKILHFFFFYKWLCERLLHSISFFSLQFRTKERPSHFKTNLSSDQNAMCTFKKKPWCIWILQSFSVFGAASSQSELTPAGGAFPPSNSPSRKASPSQQRSCLDCRLLLCTRNPEHLPQKGRHPVHWPKSDVSKKQMVLIPALEMQLSLVFRIPVTLEGT